MEMGDKRKLKATARKALKIVLDHEHGASMDAGFDAGEFSGPAHWRAIEKEIRALASERGFSFEEVMTEVDHLEGV